MVATQSSASMPSRERLRLIVMAARLYHVHGVRQRDIGTRLGMSQARVSRVLREAEQLGIVRTVVAVPDGLYPELEELLQRAYGLAEVHVIDVPDGDADLAKSLGIAAAGLFAETALGGVVGFTSWSRTLQEMAFAFQAQPRTVTRHVVEMLGDLGSPLLQHSAARATQAMATALGAEPVFLRTPGVVATAALRNTALLDPYVRRALTLIDDMDVAFVGVGPPDLHSQLHAGDSYFTPDQLTEVRAAGAVGQLNQRFLDGQGKALETSLDELVVGSTLEQVSAARRRVVVAGGPDKSDSIAVALAGGWVDVLVTDLATARSLVEKISDLSTERSLVDEIPGDVGLVTNDAAV